jgi:hypothetical protein
MAVIAPMAGHELRRKSESLPQRRGHAQPKVSELAGARVEELDLECGRLLYLVPVDKAAWKLNDLHVVLPVTSRSRRATPGRRDRL